MSERDGLIFAYALDGAGGARALDWDGIAAAGAVGEGRLWPHFNREGARSRRWIVEQSGLDPVVRQALLAPAPRPLRTRLSAVRREAIALRRYLSPQRTAMARLLSEQALELGAIDRERLREAADLITRCVEDLEASRERAAVVQDELMNRLAEDMDRTLYTLTVVAAVFLPLGFLAGLLGVNLGGMPGTDTPWAFPAFFGLMLVLAGVELMLFRRLKWI
jgi:zinc transporter